MNVEKSKTAVDDLCASKNVRAPHQRNIDRTEQYNFRWKLECLASRGQEIGFLHILPKKRTQQVLQDIYHDHGYCKNGSSDTVNVSPPKANPISIKELKDRCARI